MVRNGKEGKDAATNPEAEERKRLKRLAISNNILSEAPAKGCSVALSPSKTVIKHHGRDIIRKSNRKNRFLFSFPGLLVPISGGKLGELKDLGSKNPILYLDFPQGQMKLFGTIVYPKNRYLTLQFSRGGKNVMCEDYFETMIVFSDAWWIGRKEENPEEVRLEFPADLNVGQRGDYDFKGGAGSRCERMQGVKTSGTTLVKQQSPIHEPENDCSDSQNDLKDLIQATPSRHSARTAGKTFKFAETSSEDISVEVIAETSEGEENEVSLGSSSRNNTSEKVESSLPTFNTGSEVPTACTKVSEQLPQSAVSATKSKDLSRNKNSSLVQATISTLFKKKEEKVRDLKKKRKVIKDKKTGTRTTGGKKQPEVDDDEIEEFSDMSQDTEGSDEEWNA